MDKVITLEDFLLIVAWDGYGHPETVTKQAADGANVITCREGDWHMADTFYGGHPYSGQEVIYHRDQAVWAMQYRGWVIGNQQPNPVYQFLKAALRAAPADHPWRGPEKLTGGDMTYRNRWQGTIENFNGQETISSNGDEIYLGLYFGGLVDQK